MLEKGAKKDAKARRSLAICKFSEPRGATDEAWEILPCTTVEDMIALAKAGRIDAVAYPVDPLDVSCRPNLLRLLGYQKQGRPVLVSYSKFNPSWIENFVYGAGANIHIRGHLNLGDVTRRIEALINARDR